MKIGLISDVHANLPALEAVLGDMSDNDVESIVCAGDILGYYPFFNEVMGWFTDNDILTVMGNHDWCIVNDDYQGLNRVSNISDPFTHDNVKKDYLRWLSNRDDNLKFEQDGIMVHICHATPQSITERLSPVEMDDVFLEKRTDADILVVGHSHLPFCNRYGNKAVINPGSVGQPRDGFHYSSYGILDINKSEWTYTNRRVHYNISKVRDRIIEMGFPDELHERLYKGR